MRVITICLIAVVLLGSIPGCFKDAGENGLTQVANSASSLDTTLKRANSDAVNQSDLWRELFAKLPKELATGLQNSLDESVAGAREHAGLTIDYAEFKVQSNIESLREHLLNGLLEIQKNNLKDVDALLQLTHSFKFTPVLSNPMWKTPVVKQGGANRTDVEIDWANERSVANGTEVVLDGFGFQQRQRNDPAWRIEFYGPQKTKRHSVANAWQYLTIHSDFKATLHLGQIIEQAQRNDTVVVIAYGDKGKNCRSEIDLKHNTQPLPPESKTVTAALGKLSVIPPHTRGDDNFWGRIRFHVVGRWQIVDGILQTQVGMFATETNEKWADKPDYTTVVGDSPWHNAYVPEPGWRVVGVNVKPITLHEGVMHQDDPQPRQIPMPAGELVVAFHVFGVKDGGKAGHATTSVTADFNTVIVTLEKIKKPAK